MGLGYNGWAPTIDREMYPWADRILPISSDGSLGSRFGQQQIGDVLEYSKADVVISALDIWMIEYLSRPEKYAGSIPQKAFDLLDRNKRKFTHIAYFPLDGAVEGKYLPQNLVEAVGGIDVPITYSRFAQKVLRDDYNLDVPFIPIAHDPEVYCPADRAAAREEMGLPADKFIVGMIGTNQYRKLYGDFFTATIPFAKAHEDVAVLPWTSWATLIAGGTQVDDLVWRSGIEKQVINPGNLLHTLSDKGMSKVYQSMDVLVLCTVGEGAGLPPIRARACGIPALVSDNTSNTEFASCEFELIPNRDKFFDPFGGNFERYLTNTDVLYERLEKLYADAEMRETFRTVGPASTKEYEIGTVLPQWDSLLEQVA